MWALVLGSTKNPKNPRQSLQVQPFLTEKSTKNASDEEKVQLICTCSRILKKDGYHRYAASSEVRNQADTDAAKTWVKFTGSNGWWCNNHPEK